jgi:hypothetical protein
MGVRQGAPKIPTDPSEPVPKRAFDKPSRMLMYVFGQRLFQAQRDVLKALEKPRAKVALAGPHGFGKTFLGAGATIWFPCYHPDGIVIDTAPTFKQVRGQSWREIHRLLNSPLGRRVAWGKIERTRFAPMFDEREYRFASGETAEEESHFQGKHGTYLFCVNEAQAVGDHIYDAIDNNRAGGDVRVFAYGNTTTTEGAFWRAFHTERDLWTTFQFTVWDTPNMVLVGGERLNAEKLLEVGERRPHLLDQNEWPTVSRRWVYEKLTTWGEDHPLWKIKCLAQFPDIDEWGLINAAWLDQCERAVLDVEEEASAHDLIVGIDPAGPGKAETACYGMRGPLVTNSYFTQADDARGPVVSWLGSLGGPTSVSLIRCDQIGVGHYMIKHLEGEGYRVEGIHAQDKKRVSQPDRFADLKAEMHWRLREGFERGEIAGVVDPKTQSQLLGIRWGINGRGQIEIETKSDKKQWDRAEALVYAYVPTPRANLRLFGRGSLNDYDLGGEHGDRRDDVYRPPLAGLYGKTF